jgi:hypothetical protein
MIVTRFVMLAVLPLVGSATATGAGFPIQDSVPGIEPLPLQQLAGTQGKSTPAPEIKPREMRSQVNASGSQEASWAKEFWSQVELPTTITWILPNGRAVKKGDTVCTLNSSGLEIQLGEQTLRTKATSEAYQLAKTARETAQTVRRSFKEEIGGQQRRTPDCATSTGKTALQRADLRVERARNILKRMKDAMDAKGTAATPAELAAQLEVEDRVETAEQNLAQEKKAKERELDLEFERKALEEAAKLRALSLEMRKQEKLRQQIGSCSVHAPFDGQLVLATSPNRAGGGSRLRVGTAVRRGQRIFSLLSPIAVIDNVLWVPVNALLSVDGKDNLVAVKNFKGGFDWLKVELGVFKATVVEIKKGLNGREVLMLEPVALVSSYPPF